METDFRCSESLGGAAEADPTNPFWTAPYARAMSALGFRSFTFFAGESACAAFLKSGRVNRTLEIPSVPPSSELFWRGVRDFCRRNRVTHLEANSFASAPATIPSMAGEIARRTRFEFVLDLQKPTSMASNHIRNVRRANNAGAVLRQASDEAACERHWDLVDASLARRTARGEHAFAGDLRLRIAALRQCGAGELFQAVIGDEIVSSIFILLAERGAYYQSAGTSEKGMDCGASHFLVDAIATDLRLRSMTTLNLGGASDVGDGLARFKAGFGARVVELPAAEFRWGGFLTRTMNATAALLQS